MKQKYVKPALYLERFTLAQSIASGCEGVVPGSGALGNGPMQWSIDTCYWNYQGWHFFLESPNCNMVVQSTHDFEEYCYNNPDGDIQVFSS